MIIQRKMNEKLLLKQNVGSAGQGAIADKDNSAKGAIDKKKKTSGELPVKK